MSNNPIKQTQEFNYTKYLHDLYEGEKFMFILEKRAGAITDREIEIGHEFDSNDKEFTNSEYYQKYCNEFKQYIDYIPQTEETTLHQSVRFIYMGMAAILSLFLGGVVSCSVSMSSHSINLLPLFIITIIGGIIGLLIGKNRDANEEGRYNAWVKENDRITEKNKETEKYNNQRYYYWLSQFQDSEKNRREALSAELNYLNAESKLIYSTLGEIGEYLHSMFELKINGKTIIHTAYRKLAPISVFYGYFDTGRCTTFEGHEGAYNLYENEKRLGIIIEKLDEISAKLDILNGTMMFLGQAMIECNNKLEELNNNSLKTIAAINNVGNLVKNTINDAIASTNEKLSKIEISTANSAYYSEIASTAASFSAYYNIFRN